MTTTTIGSGEPQEKATPIAHDTRPPIARVVRRSCSRNSAKTG